MRGLRVDFSDEGDDMYASAAEEAETEAFTFDCDRLRTEAMARGCGDPWTALEWLYEAWRGTDLSSTSSDYEDRVRDLVADAIRETLTDAAREAFDAGVDHEEFKAYTRNVVMRHAVPPMSPVLRDNA